MATTSQTEIFMEIKDHQSNLTSNRSDKMKNHIPLESVSMGGALALDHTALGQAKKGIVTTRAHVQEVAVTRKSDGVTPKLLGLLVHAGKKDPLDKVTIHFWDTDAGADTLTIEIEKVWVSSHHFSASHGGHAGEQITLTGHKFTITHANPKTQESWTSEGGAGS